MRKTCVRMWKWEKKWKWFCVFWWMSRGCLMCCNCMKWRTKGNDKWIFNEDGMCVEKKKKKKKCLWFDFDFIFIFKLWKAFFLMYERIARGMFFDSDAVKECHERKVVMREDVAWERMWREREGCIFKKRVNVKAMCEDMSWECVWKCVGVREKMWECVRRCESVWEWERERRCVVRKDLMK